MPGNTLPNRTTLIELHFDGIFTVDRVVVRNELQRHCEEGYDDDEEAAEEQKREAREVQDRG